MWKIALWGPKLVKHLKTMSFEPLSNAPKTMESFDSIVNHKVFKGINLLDGWLVDGRDDKGNFAWKCKDKDDMLTEPSLFLEELCTSVSN